MLVKTASATDSRADPKPPYDKQVALVLQGGGALGSYQAGVYEALAEADNHPDWVAGISIGAINCAVIAGNAPGDRVDRLRQFWSEITAPSASWPSVPGPIWQVATRRAGSLAALLFGQPGFFKPNVAWCWVVGVLPTSYYQTDELRATLERLVDFDRINSRQIRFSVGAVNVRTGNFAYFDNARTRITADHVMASGALPPGFPAIEIDGEHYWDGGLVSNTPLQYVLEMQPRRSTLAFQVDLFCAHGLLPRDLDEISEREKDIRYSSRTRMGTESFRRKHNVRRQISQLLAKLPHSLQDEPEVELLRREACQTTMDVVQLIYRPEEVQGASKDYEFSRATMELRWRQGLLDARKTLAASPWLAPAPPEIGVRTFDVPAQRGDHRRAPPIPVQPNPAPDGVVASQPRPA